MFSILFFQLLVASIFAQSSVVSSHYTHSSSQISGIESCGACAVVSSTNAPAADHTHHPGAFAGDSDAASSSDPHSVSLISGYLVLQPDIHDAELIHMPTTTVVSEAASWTKNELQEASEVRRLGLMARNPAESHLKKTKTASKKTPSSRKTPTKKAKTGAITDTPENAARESARKALIKVKNASRGRHSNSHKATPNSHSAVTRSRTTGGKTRKSRHRGDATPKRSHTGSTNFTPRISPTPAPTSAASLTPTTSQGIVSAMSSFPKITSPNITSTIIASLKAGILNTTLSTSNFFNSTSLISSFVKGSLSVSTSTTHALASSASSTSANGGNDLLPPSIVLPPIGIPAGGVGGDGSGGDDEGEDNSETSSVFESLTSSTTITTSSTTTTTANTTSFLYTQPSPYYDSFIVVQSAFLTQAWYLAAVQEFDAIELSYLATPNTTLSTLPSGNPTNSANATVSASWTWSSASPYMTSFSPSSTMMPTSTSTTPPPQSSTTSPTSTRTTSFLLSSNSVPSTVVSDLSTSTSVVADPVVWRAWCEVPIPAGTIVAEPQPCPTAGGNVITDCVYGQTTSGITLDLADPIGLGEYIYSVLSGCHDGVYTVIVSYSNNDTCTYGPIVPPFEIWRGPPTSGPCDSFYVIAEPLNVWASQSAASASAASASAALASEILVSEALAAEATGSTILDAGAAGLAGLENLKNSEPRML